MGLSALNAEPSAGAPTFSASLAAHDRRWLETLLRLRPDLCAPTPHDLADLAARASTQASVGRALDRLDRRDRTVAEALAALGDPASPEDVAALVGLPLAEVRPALVRLTERALAWGPSEALHVLRSVREVFGPWPGGLAHPSATPLAPDVIDAAVHRTDERERAVLDRLAWGPPTGTLRNADRPLPPEADRSPVERLLASGLLRVAGPATVVLPREVALRVRGRFSPDPLDAPDDLPPGARSARLVDHAGAGAAYELVHDVEVIVDDIGTRQPGLLRTGGPGTRDLALIGRRHGVAVDRLAFLIELAHAAGLLSTTGGRLSATAAVDTWLGGSIADRWTAAARAWRDGRRWAAAALDHHALGSAGDVRWAAEVRRTALGALAVGRSVDRDVWAERIAYDRPVLARVIEPGGAVDALTTELTHLGVIALGQVSGLIDPLRGLDLTDELAALFPATVSSFVVQSDLTAVAGGPLSHDVARVLRLIADQESRGGAGVFRFTGVSIRRGFDAGWDAQTIERWLADHSSTGVPQPLAYLIGDVARVHGAIRVGRAAAYIRVEDPAQIPIILAHPRATELGLRQIGPAALVTDADPDEAVEVLRELGLAPAAEDARGSVLRAPAPPRTPARRADREPGPDPAQVARMLTDLARADSARADQTTGVLERLEVARAAARPVDITFVDDTGSRDRRRLVPARVAAGMARLVGPRTALTLPLARIIEVRDASD